MTFATLFLGASLLLGDVASADEDLVLCRIDGGPLLIVDEPPAGCVVEKRKSRRAAPVSTEDASDAVEVVHPSTPWPPRAPDGSSAEGFLDLGEPLESEESRARFDARAKDRRRDLEERANAVRGDLEDLRQQIRTLLDESRDRLRDENPGAEAYADALQRRDAEVMRLRARELEILADWRAVEREFELLSARVRRAHGGELPEDWLAALACDKCP